MRLSLCNEVIRDLEFGEQCEFAASLGYDGLEIAPFTLGAEPHLLPAKHRAGLRQSLAHAGLQCSSLHWLLVAPEGLSLTAASDSVRNRTIDVMRRLIELAADLDADVLVHGSPDQRRLVPGDEAASRQRAHDCFAAIADNAKEAGVIYCIEPLATRETDYLNSLEEASKVIEQIANPALRTMIDCAATACMSNEPLANVIERWLPTGLVAHIQVNDANRRGPGEGDVPFAPVISALKRANYKDWVAVEPFIYKPDGPACAARAAGYLRGLLEATA